MQKIPRLRARQQAEVDGELVGERAALRRPSPGRRRRSGRRSRRRGWRASRRSGRRGAPRRSRVASPRSATSRRGVGRDRREGIVVDLAPGDLGQPLVEEPDQRADHARLRLAALAEEDQVVAAEQRVLDGGDHAVVVADDARERAPRPPRACAAGWRGSPRARVLRAKPAARSSPRVRCFGGWAMEPPARGLGRRASSVQRGASGLAAPVRIWMRRWMISRRPPSSLRSPAGSLAASISGASPRCAPPWPGGPRGTSRAAPRCRCRSSVWKKDTSPSGSYPASAGPRRRRRRPRAPPRARRSSAPRGRRARRAGSRRSPPAGPAATAAATTPICRAASAVRRRPRFSARWRRATWPISWASTPASSADVARLLDRAGVHVDVAARGREGVDLVVHHDEEAVVELPLGRRRRRCAGRGRRRSACTTRSSSR